MGVTGVTLGSCLTSAVPYGAGGGYQVGEILTVLQGTGTSTATLQVTAVNGSGGVTAVSIVNPGFYTAVPQDNGYVSGSRGNGVGFTLTYASSQLAVTRGPMAPPPPLTPPTMAFFSSPTSAGLRERGRQSRHRRYGRRADHGPNSNLFTRSFLLDPAARQHPRRQQLFRERHGSQRRHPVAGATITIGISSGALSGTTTATTNSSGVASFTGLSDSTAGTYSLTASASGATGATSSSFVITSSGSSLVVMNTSSSRPSPTVCRGAWSRLMPPAATPPSPSILRTSPARPRLRSRAR